MLSTAYRLRLESICRLIANKETVPLEDMIWAEKLAKAHTTARDWLNKARRQATSEIEEGSTDLMGQMKLLIGLNRTNQTIGDKETNESNHLLK